MRILHHVTLAIVTYRRPAQLTACLASIAKQSMLPKTVLVIDNDRLAGARKVCQSFQALLPIRYRTEKRTGAPYTRNRALAACQTKYLAFVDDDCVLQAGWLEALSTAITKNPDAVYIQGKTMLAPQQNVIAKAQYDAYRRWFRTLHTQETISPRGLDTKNLCLQMPFMRQHRLRFDTRFAGWAFSSNEDIDLGLQLQRLGVSGVYNRRMVVQHGEVQSIVTLLRS